jgi:RHS repeat-associated protein
MRRGVKERWQNENGTATRFLYLDQVPVGRVSGSTTIFQHNDHTGTSVVFTDAAGGQISEAAYYPFGAVATVPAGPVVPLFAGKRFDAQIVLYYFNARWYAPDLGRFISVDPLYLYHPERAAQDPRLLNPYAYAVNNPVRFVDPSGLFFLDVLVGIAIAITSVIVPAAIGIVAGALGATLAAAGSALAFGSGVGLLGAAVGAIVGGAIIGTAEGALRGALVGFTAGVNFAVGSLVFGPLIGAALGVITFLAAIPAVSQSDVYQGILGWSSYFMPMSWPGHILGLTLFSLNVAGMLITFGQVDAFRIRALTIDPRTGNIFTVGGWIGALVPRAFNLGAFSIVNPSRFVGGAIAPATFEHESGHMLNNAAFGFIHTYASIVTAPFATAGDFWERIAESNVPPGLRGTDPVAPEPDRPRIPVWGP